MDFEVTKIDVETFEGMIPAGYDLVEYAAGTDPVADGWCLLGFDEVYRFYDRGDARHAFVKISY